MFNRVDQLIDFEVFLQLRCTEMLLIYNSNGKLENVKAEVGQVAERQSLLELESLHYWLRPIKSGNFRFANLASNFKGKCHFHFLIH